MPPFLVALLARTPLRIPELEPRPGRALRVLLLGSYDDQTKDLMRTLIRMLIDTYDPQHDLKSRRLVPLLVEDVRMFESRSGADSYWVIFEQYDDVYTFRLFHGENRIDAFDCKVADFQNSMKEIENSILASQDYREIFVTNKVRQLCQWVDLITVFKHQELTRGGELIELTMLVVLELVHREFFSSKMSIFRNSSVSLSWMVDEIMQLGRIKPIQYSSYEELAKLLRREVDLFRDRISWSP